jgi:hypothetical protein
MIFRKAISILGYSGYLISGALPLWNDSVQLVENRFFGIRVFLSSVVRTLAYLNGKPDHFGFVIFNACILISTPFILAYPVLANKGRVARAVLGTAVASQLAISAGGRYLLPSTYDLRPGYLVWVLSLILLGWGTVLTDSLKRMQP